MSVSAAWSFPTALRLAVGCVAELAEICAQHGIARPLIVTDPGVVQLTAFDAVQSSFDRPVPVFSSIQPNPVGANIDAESRCSDRAATTASSPSAVARLSTVARSSPSRPAKPVQCGTSRTSATTGPAPTAGHRTGDHSADHRGHRQRGRPGGRRHRRGRTAQGHHLPPEDAPRRRDLRPRADRRPPANSPSAPGSTPCRTRSRRSARPASTRWRTASASRGAAWCSNTSLGRRRPGRSSRAGPRCSWPQRWARSRSRRGSAACTRLSHPIGAVFDTHHGMTNAVVMPYVLAANRAPSNATIDALAAYLRHRRRFDGFLDHVIAARGRLGRAHTLVRPRCRRRARRPDRRRAIDDPSAGGIPIPSTEPFAEAVFTRLHGNPPWTRDT